MDTLERKYRLKKAQYSISEYTTLDDATRLYVAVDEILKILEDMIEIVETNKLSH